jgi:hypothetical protein
VLETALTWANRGLSVFQLQPRSKIPFPDSRGFKDATRDEATIRDWWRQHPTANIGLARLHQLNAIFAIFGASDRDKSLDLKGRGLRNRL